MLYQGIIGGGSSPVEPEDLSPVLLWTNSNPGAAFAAQTVSLDLTEYAGVIIEFHDNDTRLYVKKNDTDNTAGRYTIDTSYTRSITINDNQMVISDTYTAGSNGTQYINNTVLIPYKIYGVKEYVVESVVGDLLWTNPNPTTAFTPQKLSVDLSNSKGAIIEVMISTTTQLVCSKQLVYKGDGPVGIGYSAGRVAQTRNIANVEADGITFETGYNANTASDTILIPYKIYSIN